METMITNARLTMDVLATTEDNLVADLSFRFTRLNVRIVNEKTGMPYSLVNPYGRIPTMTEAGEYIDRFLGNWFAEMRLG